MKWGIINMKLISKTDFASGEGLVEGDVVLVGTADMFEQQTFSGQIIVFRKITSEAMRNRFTFDERVNIESSENARVKTFKNDLAAKTSPVNLDSYKMKLALALLELENCLIAKEGQTIAERKVELLDDGLLEETM